MDGKSFPVVGDLMGNGGIGSEGGEDDDMMMMILSRSRRSCVCESGFARAVFWKRLLTSQLYPFRVFTGTSSFFSSFSRTFEP
jgi:hypothetical protein